MLAVITGASSGLGMEFALKLDKMGYDTVIVARRRKKLEELKKMLKHNCTVVEMDISDVHNCKELFSMFPDADLLVNNAGFGIFGEIAEADLDTAIQMINTNVTALYTLMHLYLKRFKEKKRGYILNIASAAAFMAGPYFGLYYATKSFVMRITQAAGREAREYGVTVSTFCPGSVSTEFNSVAKTTFSSKPITPEFAVEKALNGLFKGKILIMPTFKIKAAFVMSKLLPEKLLTEFSYKIQKKRM